MIGAGRRGWRRRGALAGRFVGARGWVVGLGIWGTLGGGCVGRNVMGGSGESVGSGGVETGSESGAVPTGGGVGSGDVTSVGVGSGTTGADGAESGADFVVKPDGEWPIQCDVFKQDCAVGEKCVGWTLDGEGGAWNATKCVEVMGEQKPGEPCMVVGPASSGEDDCAKGGRCWDVNPEGVGVCLALCAGSPDAPVCHGNSICSVDEVLNLCFPGCDPLLQDCPGDEICVPWPGHGYFGCLSDVSGDLGVVNDPCDFAKTCDRGLVCLDAGAASSACLQGVEGCCQPFCAFVEGEDGECPNGDQACVQWVDELGMVIEGLEDVGVCRIAL